jgi:hypothetical protein
MTNRVITWVMIMALLISQSYAYAFVPCELNAHASSRHIDDMDSKSMGSNSFSSIEYVQSEHDMPNHMQHDMKQDTQQQKMVMDCCDQECSCLTGTCASATLTHLVTATALNPVSDSSVFYLFSIQETFLLSLSKPPIIG